MTIGEFIIFVSDEWRSQRGLSWVSCPDKVNLASDVFLALSNTYKIPMAPDGSFLFMGMTIHEDSNLRIGGVLFVYDQKTHDTQHFSFYSFSSLPAGSAKIIINQAPVMGSVKLSGTNQYPYNVSIPGPSHYWIDTSAMRKPTGCSHIWKEYIGFTDRFDFCELCQEKRRT